MPATYIFTREGIILVQGGSEAINILKEFANQVYSEMVNAYKTFDEAKTIAEYMQNAISSMDPALEGIKVVSSAAFGTAAEIAAAPLGPAAAATAGIAAGKIYDDAF